MVDVSVEGWRAQILKSDLRHLGARPHESNVQLLPNFDPYLLGHANRDHLYDPVHRWKVSRVAGWISPVVLVDGRVLGVWSHFIKGPRLAITITPFDRLPAMVVREAKTRAESIAETLGVSLDRVTVA
jgi:hypothetical protein